MKFNVVEVSSVFTKQEDTSSMRRCFFDLEGSLNPEEGCILQLATVITDWNFNITDADVRYFKTDMEIKPEEQRVHKITNEILDEHATQMFHEYIHGSHLAQDNTMFISFTTFDVRRINAELKKRGMEGTINFGSEASSLRKTPSKENNHLNGYLLAPGKLTQYINRMPGGDMEALYNEVSKFTTTHNFSAHDALYDTLALYHLCKNSYK